MPYNRSQSPFRAIGEASILLLIVAAVAHWAWLLLQPLVPVLVVVGLLLVVVRLVLQRR